MSDAALYRSMAAALGVKDAPMGLDEAVWTLAHSRAEFRRRGNYAEADRIRDALSRLGWGIEDRPGGEWRMRRHD